MENKTKIVDKQVGRNSDLFAQAIAGVDSREARYPYIRILVSIIEQAHPEWNQAPNKDRQVANLVFRMSLGQLAVEEVSEIVRLRDAERGYGPPPPEPSKAQTPSPADSSKTPPPPAVSSKAPPPPADSSKAPADSSNAQAPSPADSPKTPPDSNPSTSSSPPPPEA
jgi:hypothetical protein